MTHTGTKRLLSLCFSVVLTGAAFAQDPPQEEPVEEVKPAQWNWAELVYQDTGLSGDFSRFQRHGVPLSGFGIGSLGLLFPLKPGSPYGRLVTAGPGQGDSSLYATGHFFGGRTLVDVDLLRRNYYQLHPGFFDVSEDRGTRVSLRQNLATDLGLYVVFQRDHQDHYFAGPRPAVKTRTRTTIAGVEGRVLDGQAGVSYTDTRFVDRNGFQPESSQRRWDVRYGRDLGQVANVEGALAWTKLDQEGVGQSEVKSASIGGDLMLGPDTEFTADLAKDTYDLPGVANAYVRERFTSKFGLSHRMGRWSGSVAYRHREAERLRKDQSFVDVVKTDRIDAKVTGRIADGVRATGRISWEHGGNAALMQTADPRQLYWDRRVRGQLRVEGMVGQATAYANYSFNYVRNDQRDIDVRTDTLSFGATRPLGDKADAYFEFSRESTWANGTDGGGQPLDPFYPTSNAFVVGANWMAGPATWLSLDATFLSTDNDNLLSLRDGNTRSRYFTATLRHRLPTGNELSLTVAPWNHDDRLYDDSTYRATIVRLALTARF